MIEAHSVFRFREKEVIERLVIRAPFRYIRPFQESACFLYLREGEAVVYAADKSVPMGQRESILLRCGTYFGDLLHRTKAASCVVYAIHLYPELLREIYSDEVPSFILHSGSAVTATHLPVTGIIDKFIESLDFYFGNPSVVNDDLLKLKLKELILLLLQTANASTVRELIAGLFTTRSTELRELVATHLYSGLNVEELAQLSNRSLSSFKREFREVYGEAPSVYLRNARLERAMELLRVSDDTIGEVAFRVGYADLAHFSRAFRQHFGFPPSTVRAGNHS